MGLHTHGNACRVDPQGFLLPDAACLGDLAGAVTGVTTPSMQAAAAAGVASGSGASPLRRAGRGEEGGEHCWVCER